MKTKLRVRKDLRCRHSLKTSLFRRLGRVSSTSERSQRVVHARTPIELESLDRSEPVGQYVPHAGGVLWTEKVRTSYNRKSLRDEFKKKRKTQLRPSGRGNECRWERARVKRWEHCEIAPPEGSTQRLQGDSAELNVRVPSPQLAALTNTAVLGTWCGCFRQQHLARRNPFVQIEFRTLYYSRRNRKLRSLRSCASLPIRFARVGVNRARTSYIRTWSRMATEERIKKRRMPLRTRIYSIFFRDLKRTLSWVFILERGINHNWEPLEDWVNYNRKSAF